MEEILNLFSIYLDPQNSSPDLSGKQILLMGINSIDLLFKVIEAKPELQRSALVFLKRVIDINFNKMENEERESVINFILNTLIPLILPQETTYSPLVAEIFDTISKEQQFSQEFVLQYISSLQGAGLNYFILLTLNKIGPINELINFVINIINSGLESKENEIIYESLSLMVAYLKEFQSNTFFLIFQEKIVEIISQKSSASFWILLDDLPFSFSVHFLDIAFMILQNNEFEYEDRVSCFNFIVSHFNSELVNTIDLLLRCSIEFQIATIHDYDDADVSLFFLFQKVLEIIDIRNDAFNSIKEYTLSLISSGDNSLRVCGLYSFAYLIDNASDLCYNIIDNLYFLNNFLQSNNILIIKGCFEILEIIIGKPIANYLQFSTIFDNIIELLVGEDEFIRNKAVNLIYKYVHSKFVDVSFIFDKLVCSLNLIKITEISLILEIIADVITIHSQYITDEQIDFFISIITDIINSKRDIDIKISAAYLCCSLIQNDADKCFTIVNFAIGILLQGLSVQNNLLKKLSSIGLIRFIKCTFGKYINVLLPFYQEIVFYSVHDSLLSKNHEPLLLIEISKKTKNIPGKESFINLLLQKIFHSTNVKQYKIASLCLKKIIWQFPMEIQLQVTEKICNTIFLKESRPLFKFNILLLISMLKDRSPLENRIAISQQIVPLFQEIPHEIITNFIGSICMLCKYLIQTFGSEIPDIIKIFLNKLFIKTQENPLYFSHYSFFVFSECFKQLIKIDILQTILDEAFDLLGNNTANLDAICCLLCIKEAIFKSLDFLTKERVETLTNFWISIQDNPSMKQTNSYLSNILFYLGCNNIIKGEIFLSSIRKFPTSLKETTREMCYLIINNYIHFNNFDYQIQYEILKGIIRLLSSGKSIRYCHKIDSDVINYLIDIANNISQTLKCNTAEVISECLPASPRKQNIVLQLLSKCFTIVS